MDGAFHFLEGLTFYGTLVALAVMAGVWYFWWHILPKIRTHDHVKSILLEIIPKLGEDVDKIEKELSDLRKLIMGTVAVLESELPQNREILTEIAERAPLYITSLEDIKRTQKLQMRKLLQHISSLSGRSISQMYTDDFDLEPEEKEIPIGMSTNEILDELDIEDIRGVIRNDNYEHEYEGSERRKTPDRRSGIDRRMVSRVTKDDRRMMDRRSGRDRRQDSAIEHLKKLSNIVDTLQEDQSMTNIRLQRRSRISDF